MKKYKRKKKITSTKVFEPPSYLASRELVCPSCGETGEIVIRSYERNYHLIASIDVEDGFAEFGDLIDGETQEEEYTCDNCCSDVNMIDAIRKSIKKLAENQ